MDRGQANGLGDALLAAHGGTDARTLANRRRSLWLVACVAGLGTGALLALVSGGMPVVWAFVGCLVGASAAFVVQLARTWT